MFGLSHFFFALVAVSSSLVIAAPATANQTSNSTDLFPICGDREGTCVDQVLAKTGCNLNASDGAACVVSQDYHFQVDTMRCLFAQLCSPKDAVFSFILMDFFLGLNDTSSSSTSTSTSTGSTTTTTPSSATSPSANSSDAPANAFSLPGCGMDCIKKTTYSNCTADSRAPSCVCPALAVENSEPLGDMWKCFVESCDDTAAAASIFGIERDCAGGPEKVNVDQVIADPNAFPFNKFAAASKELETAAKHSFASAMKAPWVSFILATLIGLAVIL